MKSDVDIGFTNANAPALVDLEELLATRLLVQGNSGSGKSYLLRRLLEQSAGLVQQVVIDPEGDFTPLAERYGHLVVDGARSEVAIATIATRVRQHRASVVLDLEGLDVDGQLRCAARFLNGLFEVDRDYWFPVLVVVDEAQLFAPSAAADASDDARRQSLAAMTNLMCRGRKRGLAGVIATQRLAKLAKNVAAEASNFLMGRTFLDIDMARAADLLGMERRQAEAFRDLQRGTFVGLGPAISRRPLTIRIGPVETSDRGGAPKLLPLPNVAGGGDLHELILADGAPPPRLERVRRPRSEGPDEVLKQIEQAPRPAYVAALQPDLTDDEREAVIEEIVAAIMADENAITQPPIVLYRDFLVRCRIRRLGADVPDALAFRRRLTIARARGAFAAGGDEEAWSRAIEVSRALPEDMQGVYLMLCRAAIAGKACPADDRIARFFGSHSPGRARRLLNQMEAIGAIVCRNDFQRRRIIAFPDLSLETAASEADEEVGMIEAS